MPSASSKGTCTVASVSGQQALWRTKFLTSSKVTAELKTAVKLKTVEYLGHVQECGTFGFEHKLCTRIQRIDFTRTGHVEIVVVCPAARMIIVVVHGRAILMSRHRNLVLIGSVDFAFRHVNYNDNTVLVLWSGLPAITKMFSKREIHF
jgi:hypothetical protein